MAFSSYMPQMPSYGQYNPLMPYQQQLASMQQQYGAMQPQQPAQPQMQSTPSQIKGWPVNSEDEARKAMVDLDGSIFIFPDVQTGRIYTKQINTADFSPIFRTYQIVDTPVAAPAVATPIDTSVFAQKDEVDQLKTTVAAMQETIERLTAPQQTAKEAKAK